MSPERAHAYRRVMDKLAEAGPDQLLASEQDQIRCAADALIFSLDLEHDAEASNALEDVERLCRRLVESERWEKAEARVLAEDLVQCGPGRPPKLVAA